MNKEVCQLCKHPYTPSEDRLIDGKSELCIFCYEWAVRLSAAYKISKMKSPSLWSKEFKKRYNQPFINVSA